MRGPTTRQAAFTAITPDQKVPRNHPIRRIKALVEPVLKELSPLFDEMYAVIGRPSIPPEHLLKGTLYSVRSERQFCERLEYDLLFKWFLDLNIDDPAFAASTFSKNRGRLMEHAVAPRFMQAVLEEAGRRRLLSGEHFTVDGTQCRELDVTPHVAPNLSGRRKGAIDGRVTRHAGYAQSQGKRKLVEKGFDWMKTVGACRKLRYIGVLKNQFWMTMEAVAYNLPRMANLQARPA